MTARVRVEMVYVNRRVGFGQIWKYGMTHEIVSLGKKICGFDEIRENTFIDRNLHKMVHHRVVPCKEQVESLLLFWEFSRWGWKDTENHCRWPHLRWNWGQKQSKSSTRLKGRISRNTDIFDDCVGWAVNSMTELLYLFGRMQNSIIY